MQKYTEQDGVSTRHPGQTQQLGLFGVAALFLLLGWYLSSANILAWLFFGALTLVCIATAFATEVIDTRAKTAVTSYFGIFRLSKKDLSSMDTVLPQRFLVNGIYKGTQVLLNDSKTGKAYIVFTPTANEDLIYANTQKAKEILASLHAR